MSIVALDLALLGGTIVDGLGGEPRREDVGVRDGRIVALGDLRGTVAERSIDVTGLTVIPGIVDLHSHSDLTILSDGRARSTILQGVTTEVVGNCGLAPFPLTEASRARTRESISIIDLDPAVDLDWSDYDSYAAALGAAGLAVNIAPLVGHVPLRLAAAPQSTTVLTVPERQRLLGLLDRALAAGAVGFSTGLMYPPAMFADRAELHAIGEVVASHGALFSIHARNYSTHLLDAVDEALDIAAATGCRLQFSHLAVAGRANWGSVARALDRVDRAREAGVDVGVDIYPYLAGSANLSQLLPEWSQGGGADAIVERLNSPRDRERIVAEWPQTLVLGWDEIVVSFVDGDLVDVLGMTIEQIAEHWHVNPPIAALEVIRRSHNRAMMVAYGRSEDDLLAVLRHPAAAIGSDGLSLDPDGPTGAGLPHPRSYGCYPRLIGRMVHDGELRLERAVAMSTSIPAARVGLSDRGVIREGAVADLAVLDVQYYRDTATYTQPAQFPTGVVHVFVAGDHAVADGRQQNGVRRGAVLRVREDS